MYPSPGQGERRPKRAANLAGWLVLFSFFCIILVLVAKALQTGGENRFAGFDIRILLGASAAGLAWAIVAGLTRMSGRTLVALLVLMSVILAVAVLVLDQMNVLITYETWVRRGYPEPWTRGVSGEGPEGTTEIRGPLSPAHPDASGQ
jgi:hypothetical protein